LSKRPFILTTTSPGAAPSGPKRLGKRRNWQRADLLFVILLACFLGLLIFFNRSILLSKHSLPQGQAKAIARQLSALSRSDLIVFSDGRVWYVRSVRGNNIEIVGWIGDNTESEEINSFVLAGDSFTIVRQNDPKWAEARDKYFRQ
jgi:hypothetical protein